MYNLCHLQLVMWKTTTFVLPNQFSCFTSASVLLSLPFKSVFASVYFMTWHSIPWLSQIAVQLAVGTPSKVFYAQLRWSSFEEFTAMQRSLFSLKTSLTNFSASIFRQVFMAIIMRVLCCNSFSFCWHLQPLFNVLYNIRHFDCNIRNRVMNEHYYI